MLSIDGIGEKSLEFLIEYFENKNNQEFLKIF